MIEPTPFLPTSRPEAPHGALSAARKADAFRRRGRGASSLRQAVLDRGAPGYFPKRATSSAKKRRPLMRPLLRLATALRLTLPATAT